MKIKKKTVLAFIIIMWSGFLYAWSGDYMGDLGEVVVTPARSVTEAYRWPGSVSVISRREIIESGARTVDELLSSLEGVSVNNLSGTTGRATVDIRGTGENSHLRTLILLDGRRINRVDIGQVNWLEIPLAAIERIEVVRGPSGVMHGSSAAGGVINIISRSGEPYETLTLKADAGSYGVFGQQFSYGRGNEIRGVYLSAERRTEKGYRLRSGADSEGIYLSYREGGLPAGINCAVRASYISSSYQMPGGLTREELKEDPKQARYTADFDEFWNPVRKDNSNDEAFETRSEISGEFGIPLSPAISFTLNTAYSLREEQVDMASFPSFFDRDMDSVSLSPALGFETEMRSVKVNAMVGGDFYRNNLNVSLFDSEKREEKDSATSIAMPVYGGYVHGELQPLSSLILSGGYRIEEASIEVDHDSDIVSFKESRHHTGSAFRAGAVLIPAAGIRSYVSYGTHYRYPAADEQASYQGGPEGFFPDLDAEHGYSVEAGMGVGLGRAVFLDISAYRMIIDDMISFDADPAVWRNVNIDRTRRDAMEARLLIPVEKVNFKVGASVGRTIFEKGEYKGSEIPLVPSYEYTAAVSAPVMPDIRLLAGANYTGRRYAGGDYANEDDKLKAYTVVNSRCVINVVQNTELILGIKNLFNEKYSVSYFGAWYPAAGRNYNISVRAAF